NSSSGATLNGATLNLTNSTLSGNTATGFGGAVYTEGPTDTLVNITNCTITNNRADSDSIGAGTGTGGGLDIFGNAQVTLRNSIVDLNFRGASPGTTADDISGPVITTTNASTHNLIGNCVGCGLVEGVDNNSLNVAAA